MGKVANFIFLDSKITADGDCSHEIKRCLLLGRKVMTNLELDTTEATQQQQQQQQQMANIEEKFKEY